MNKIITAGLAAGLGMLVVSVMISFLVNTFIPTLNLEYQNGTIFRPWTDPLMFLIYIHPFILGVVLAVFWHKVKDQFESYLIFALYIWLVASLPGMFITYSSFHVSLLMVVLWSLTGLCETIVGSKVIAKIDRR
jgi:hypothetical protein